MPLRGIYIEILRIYAKASWKTPPPLPIHNVEACVDSPHPFSIDRDIGGRPILQRTVPRMCPEAGPCLQCACLERCMESSISPIPQSLAWICLSLGEPYFPKVAFQFLFSASQAIPIACLRLLTEFVRNFDWQRLILGKVHVS
jgi:hypothetical protein